MPFWVFPEPTFVCSGPGFPNVKLKHRLGNFLEFSQVCDSDLVDIAACKWQNSDTLSLQLQMLSQGHSTNVAWQHWV